MPRNLKTGMLAGIAALALVASACSSGGGNDNASAASGGSTAPAPSTGSGTSTLDKILKNKELRVGMTLQFKPEMYLDDNNQPAGYDVDLVNMLAKDLDVKLTISNLDFDGLIPGLLADKFDMISVGLVARPPRLLQMYFTDPYVPYEQVLAVQEGDDRPATIDSYNQSGVTITALQGATAAEQVKSTFPNATLKEFPQQDPAFLEVASGRADGIVVEKYLADGFIKANPGKLKIAEFPAPLNIEFGSWAIPRGDNLFLAYLNSWLRYYKNNGTMDNMYNSTFGATGPVWARG
jgi:polar amino acid transport system substrate-binding protein